MGSYLMETGTKLELRKIRHVETVEETVYVSRYLYEKSADEAVVAMPVKAGSVITLEPGEAFQVCFYTSKGLYQCQAMVSDRFYEDGLPVAVIKFRSEFEKLQRRQYYRMECLLNLNFRVVDEEELDELLWEKSNAMGLTVSEEEELTEKEETTAARYYEGVALDISGGGVRFNSQFQAQSGDTIALKIAFLSPDAMKLQLLFAKVLTVIPVPNRNGLFEHRVQFTHITNAERESIIRYIFLEERKRRKKESGAE
ncbi:MAG: PilZ domain-containing protein [Lachnospiraceae bacterium]|nr:PilZ domain-containing protein [Lachnospiraceae bacterium]